MSHGEPNEEETDAELLQRVISEMQSLFEHDPDGRRIVEGIEAMIELKIAMAFNEIADAFDDQKGKQA